MICFGSGHIDWNAVSAIATIGATFVALIASVLALWAPAHARRVEQQEAAREVLSATNEALAIHTALGVLLQNWNETDMSKLRAKSSHLYYTIERLISRSFLTDGVIATGSGAMSIAGWISDIPSEQDLRRAPLPNATKIEATLARLVTARPEAERVFAALHTVIEVVTERAAKVRAHYKISDS